MLISHKAENEYILYIYIIYTNKGCNLLMLKYNELQAYRKWLENSHASSTALTYYKAMDYLLNNQHIIDCSAMDINLVIENMRDLKYKNQYAKYKNAFLKFCDFKGIALDINLLNELKDMNETKLRKHRSSKPIKLQDIKNHIKVIRNKRLKLSYETMLATGLRVSELAGITKDATIVTDADITFAFIAKGGACETVIIDKSENAKLFIDLTQLIKSTKQEKPIFYSAGYLQSKACDMGFTCHDLRRAFALLKYRQCKDLDTTRAYLRHKNIKTTKLYLKSKVDIGK